jgi:hypothetical protein
MHVLPRSLDDRRFSGSIDGQPSQEPADHATVRCPLAVGEAAFRPAPRRQGAVSQPRSPTIRQARGRGPRRGAVLAPPSPAAPVARVSVVNGSWFPHVTELDAAALGRREGAMCSRSTLWCQCEGALPAGALATVGRRAASPRDALPPAGCIRIRGPSVECTGRNETSRHQFLGTLVSGRRVAGRMRPICSPADRPPDHRHPPR